MDTPSQASAPLSPAKRALLELALAKGLPLPGSAPDPVAVVGMACRFPGPARDLGSFWRVLRDGLDTVSEVPPDRWDLRQLLATDPDAAEKTVIRWGGFLEDFDRFDAHFFSISGAEAPNMDPQQRLVLEVAWEALEDAGLPARRLAGSSTGVFLGVHSQDYGQLAFADPRNIGVYSSTGMAHSIAANRLSYALDLQGPSVALDTACSSSLVAVHLACQSLRRRECTAALCGGVNAIAAPYFSYALARAQMLAPDGRCKAFDSRANGFVRGEGCGILVLKRLADAVREGDRVLAVVRGSAVNQDGATNGLTAPNGLSQQRLLRQALQDARLSAAQLSYVEAHGTGTALGDPIELEALAAVRQEGGPTDQPLTIGSVKTNLGHLEAAAGVAGVIKTVLCLQHQQIAPSLHFREPNPHVRWDRAGFRVPTALTPWPRGPQPRRAGVSSFGFGGTNAHVVLEEAPAEEPAPAGVERPLHLLCLSAKTEPALLALAGRYRDHLRDHPGEPLADTCFTANVGRVHFEHRLALVAGSAADAGEHLAARVAGQQPAGMKRGRLARRPRVAWLFTGQGSQYAGMGRQLFQTQPTFREALEQCAELLLGHLDRPLLEVLFPTADSISAGTPLGQTAYAQPALFALEYGLARLWLSWGLKPDLVLGHSAGEYVAACLAGVFGLEDGLRLIAARARLMQALPAGGRMAAVFAPAGRVAAALAAHAGAASVAAYNGPENVVISGAGPAVEAVLGRLAAEGIQSQPLAVSHAFHSPLMGPMLDEFRRAAAGVSYSAAQIPLACNRDGSLRGDEVLDAAYWVEHVTRPVEFLAGVKTLAAEGADVWLEVGPGPVLLGMARRCLPEGAGRVWLPSLRRGQEDWRVLLESAASLYVRGVEIDWQGFERGYPWRRKVSLPTYPFQRQRYWVDRRPAAAADPAGHPLLGAALQSVDRVTFESAVAADRPAYLGAHRVYGTAVFPTTGYLEMALAAARATWGDGPVAVEEVQIPQALVLPEKGASTLQLVLTPEGKGHASFQIFSRGEGSPWALHAAGRLRQDASPTPPCAASLEDWQRQCGEPVPIPAFYEQWACRGLTFGPAFRGVARLDRGAGQALGRIQAPPQLAGEGAAYLLHPALLDACLQTVLAALPDDPDAVYLPVAVQAMIYRAPLPAELYCHARVQPAAAAAQSLSADLTLVDDSGRVLARVEGLALKRAGRQALESVGGPDLEDWLYAVTWEPQPLPGGILPAPFEASPRRIAERLHADALRLGTAHGLGRYGAFAEELETLSADYVRQAFARLGWRPAVGERVGTAALAERLRVLPRHGRLLERMLHVLAEDGWIERKADWQVLRALGAGELSSRRQALLAQYPDFETELTLLARCGEQLAAVLRGARDPLQLLFPSGEAHSAERLYQDAPTARVLNALAARALAAAARGLPEGRTLRVLEVGAGTGATAAAVLPLLDPARTEYAFTDLSAGFWAGAREKLAAYPFVSYRVLDVEADPRAQGFAAHGYDVVVAANVLHATADLRRTLGHVKGLLAPGGLLVLLEVVRPQRWLDLTFGLLEGWWKFGDHPLRSTSPLLPAPGWVEVLGSLGFAEAAALPEAAAGAGQAVILARGPEAEEAPPRSEAGGRWLIVTDPDGVGAALAERLRAAGGQCALVEAGADFDQLRKAMGNGTPLRGAIHLGSLGATAPETAKVADVQADQLLGTASVLHLVQALVQAGGSARLWLATRGAQAVDDLSGSAAPAQAPVWGLGQVVALEHPELRCVRIDLDPAADPAAAADMLWAELSAEGGEDQVAFRGGQRCVARLKRSPAGAEGRLAVPEAPFQLTIRERGTPDNLEFQAAEPPPPGPGEVQVEVRAAGLNFRDVLNALGLRPGDLSPPGGEFAGTVAALGPGVEGLAVGDAVVGLATGGSFASLVTTPAALVAPQPAGLSPAEAAALPTAFVTAAYCLHHLARIRAGERVLIHAAAGGVGLAAVQLAQRAGAEVYATASPPKWAYLRSLGVRHVFHSRTLDFAEQVRAQTGGRGMDVVLNSLAGDFIPNSLAVLAPSGRFVEIGKRGIWSAEQVAEARPDVRYHVLAVDELMARDPAGVGAVLGEVMQAFEAGELRVPRHTVYPLGEAVQAFRAMQQGRNVGKLVLAVPRGGARFRPDASYLITGGLGGLGLLTARWLVERGARHLVLVGRRPPGDAAALAVAELKERGAQVLVCQADVANPEEVARVLDEAAARLPPLRGIVHAAGALDDGVLAQQTWPRFRTVLAAKVDGAWNLHASTRRLPLDFLVFYSSTASLLGSPGQGNHSAANAFLDSLASYRKARGLPALSVNWGAWGQVGAAAERGVLERARARGFGVIEPRHGLRALALAWGQDRGRVGVAAMDWGQFLGQLPAGQIPPYYSLLEGEVRRRPEARPSAAAPGEQLARWQQAPADRTELLADYVQGQVTRVLGLDPAILPDRSTGFTDLGMDSLMAVELRNRLQADLGPAVNLAATLVFDYPTIDALSRHLAGQLLPQQSTPAPVRRAPPVGADTAVAIVGMGCRFPGGAGDPESFWRLLREGVDAIAEVPKDRWDVDAYYDPDPDAPGKMVTRCGGFLAEVDRFDPAFFGIAPREAVGLDPQQRLVLEVAWEALEHAGIAAASLAGSSTGVFLGLCNSDYAHMLRARDEAAIDAYLATGTCPSVAAGRLSYLLGLQGPSLALDTACSSSLVAVHAACQSLRGGECDLALAGGVNVILSPALFVNFTKARMLSPDGRCKTFDAAADGFARGEGCGVVVLKRLADAQAGGDRVLAVVRGSAVNQDGRSSGLTAPNGPSQEAVIRRALAAAGLKPADVAYVEAHGTGTALGDPIEAQALGAALGEGRPAGRPLLVGSVKANLGHLEGAAGVAGLIKVVLALQHGEIPAQLHFHTPSPLIPWERLPLAVARERAPWPAGRRVAGVSSFGFSGTNAHVLVEGAPAAGPAPAAVERPLHLLALSAKSDEALRELAARYRHHLAGAPAESLPDVCFTAGTGRSHLERRLALVAESAGQARDKLDAWIAGQQPAGLKHGHGGERPRVAWLFTGQGSQYAGMGRQLYQTQPTFRKALEHCAEVLRGQLDRPLLEVMFPPTDSSSVDTPLGQTAYAQPALFALEYGLARLWLSWGLKPDLVLGHSAGEYVAACLAGVFGLEDGLRLIAARARLMQALPAGGRMAAVFAPAGRVAAALAAHAGAASVAAYNGPENVVISGAGPAVEAVLGRLAAEGIQSQPLAVSHAFHSPLMGPVLDEFRRAAAAIEYGPARIPLASNRDGRLLGPDEVLGADYWVEHVRRPVAFAAGIQTLATAGCDVWLEVGPSPVLLGMARRCLPEDQGGLWLPSLRRGQEDWRALLESVAELYVEGVKIDWTGFDRDYPRRRKLALPTYPFQRQRYWVEQARRQRAAAHPLLGKPVRSAASREVVFECPLAAGGPAYLGDHRVYGAAVFPAAAYLEMALAGAREALGGGLPVVEEVEFPQALVLPETGQSTVQLVLTPPEAGQSTFKVFSCAGDGGAHPDWALHAAGRVRLADGTLPEPVIPDELRRQCAEEVEVTGFYRRWADRGLAYGPAFRGIAWMARGEGLAVSRVKAPPTVAAECGSYVLHPALLDACLQTVAGLLPPDDPDAVYLPVSVGRMEVYGTAGAELFCDARLHPAPDGKAHTLKADLRLADGSGRVLAVVEGLGLRQATRQALERAGRADVEGWLYEVAWKPQPLPGQILPAAFQSSPEEIAGQLQAEALALSAAHGLDQYGTLVRELEGLSASYVRQAFARLGWRLVAGERTSAAGLAALLRVQPRHDRLVRRCLDLLAEDGWLRQAGTDWQVLRTDAPDDLPARRDALRARYPAFQTEVHLLDRCGEQLAAVLRGARDPLQLLFPSGEAHSAERLYQDAPTARVLNALAARALAAAAQGLPEGRTLRVLEVGAGTGATAAAVLPLLDPARTEYAFTDLSAGFWAGAREKLAAYPFVSYRVLDVEADPRAQGFAAHGYDVVVAANVLHATADLRRTLGHVKGLLAPGGLLVLLEVVQSRRWQDLTFGLLEGWWKYSDADLRPASPLLPTSKWLELLGGLGFTRPGTLAPPTAEQAVILARAPAIPDSERRAGTPPAAAGLWLILDDSGGTGTALAERLRAAGGRCVLAEAGDDYRVLAADRYRANPVRPADFERLLAAVPRSETGTLRGVVHLWGLESTPADPATLADVQADQERGVAGALHLVQALVRTGGGAGLWLVTRGAQAVDALAGTVAPAQAPVWGLGKVIALEHPELRCVRIDLDPAADPAAAVDLLWAELFAEGGEDQVAFRQGQRHVARLRRSAAVAQAEGRLTVPEEPYRLRIEQRGTLDNLRLEPVGEPPPPGPGEVQVEVRAAGLNFRDVLNALGLRPGDLSPPGGEFAGAVAALGPGVEGLAVGDAVVGLATGSFASLVTTPAALVARQPAGLSPAEAAGLPTAFVTAWYCLGRLARIRAGERVLIHAAAGGVGLAAVQLAQRAGAEVYATASPPKWAYLRSLGVRHVFHSRTLDFAEQVRAQTGGRGADVVLNSLAGEFIPNSLDALAPGGRFLEIGKRDIWTAEQVAEVRPDVSYHVIALDEMMARDPEGVGEVLGEVLGAFAAGELRPLRHTVYPLARAVRAFRTMQQGRHVGKLVLSVPPGCGRFRADASYLITGGLGGLGLLTARWLVGRGARHLVLMGRAAPAAGAREAVAGLEQAGARVLVASGDVSRAEDVRRVLAEAAAALPPLRGAIHSAGAVDDGVLTQQTWERFRAVFAAKVGGAWNLHRLTAHLPLDFLVLYSSTAALLGSPGQGNHSAANAFLDALAAHRRGRGLPALSINWGAWGQVGAAVKRGVLEHVGARGIGVIEPEQGLAALARVWGQDLPQVGVVPVDWARYLSKFPSGEAPAFLSRVAEEVRRREPERPAAAAGDLLGRLRQAPAGERLKQVTGYVQAQVARVLGLDGSRPPDRRQGFTELGMDSLMAVELRNRFQSDLAPAASLSATLLFDYPTIDALARHLAATVLAPSPVADGVPAPQEEKALAEIQHLSQEQLDALLEEELASLDALRGGE